MLPWANDEVGYARWSRSAALQRHPVPPMHQDYTSREGRRQALLASVTHPAPARLSALKNTLNPSSIQPGFTLARRASQFDSLVPGHPCLLTVSASPQNELARIDRLRGRHSQAGGWYTVFR